MASDELLPVVLNIDDTEAHRYAVSKVLKGAGFEVMEAGTGEEAIALAQHKPALIILDVNLPDINGFEVCRRLKDDPSTSSIPVLHISATAIQVADKTEGLRGGADGYLAEPVHSEELLATVRAILRVREAEQRARVLAQHWQSTFDAIQDGVGLVGGDGKITHSNRSLQRVFGRSESELAGKPFLATLQASLGSLHQLTQVPSADSTERRVVEGWVGERWLRLVTDPVRDLNGEVQGTVRILVDLTISKQIELSFRESEARHQRERQGFIDELSRSNAELAQFASIASHDLKEPLRTVRSYLGLLEKKHGPKLEAEAHEFIGFAVDAARRMSALIDALLEYSRIGNQEPVVEPLDLDSVLDDILASLDQVIQEKQATFEREPLPTVRGDRVLISQLFQNLLSNALKFQGAERPVVRITAIRKEGFWNLRIKDNGIGVEPNHAERIFRMFQRLHTPGTYPGSGIGLAVCKRIVERHGGKIWLGPSSATGAEFCFTLPE